MPRLMITGAARVTVTVAQQETYRTSAFVLHARHLLPLLMMVTIVSRQQPQSTLTMGKQSLCLSWK